MPTPRAPRSGSQGTKTSPPAAAAEQAATEPTYTGNGGAAPDLVSKVRQQASSQVHAQKERAAASIGSFAQAMRQTGDQLRSQNEVLASYVDAAVDQLQRLSDRIREKDPAEFVDDLNAFARRRPTVFVGTAFLLGVGLARFLKSTSDAGVHRHTRFDAEYHVGGSAVAHDLG